MSIEDEFEELAETLEVMPDQEKDAYIKIYDALNEIHQKDSGADRGLGFGSMDVWLTIGGREYFVNVKTSLRQDAMDKMEELANRSIN